MEAWLTLPIRLVLVVLVAFVAYAALSRVRLPLTGALQASSSTDQPTSEQAAGDDRRPAIAWLIAVATFGTAIVVGESLAISRFSRACRRIESLGGSIRFDPPNDSTWARFFFSAATVDLSDTAVNDQSSIDLAAIPKLKTLRLANTQIGEATLRSLTRCRSITGLDLSGSSIGDNDLGHLRSIRRLRSLILDSTSITDSSIAHLTSCRFLTDVRCDNTGISSQGYETLMHALDGTISA